MLTVNTESFFMLLSALANIFVFATAADNYIYKVGSFAFENRFENKWLVPVLRFKEFTLDNTIAAKANFSTFYCFESWFYLLKSLKKIKAFSN